MSGGEPSSIKRIGPCAARTPFLSWLHGKRVWYQVRMRVCDLAMGRNRKNPGGTLRLSAASRRDFLVVDLSYRTDRFCHCEAVERPWQTLKFSIRNPVAKQGNRKRQNSEIATFSQKHRHDDPFGALHHAAVRAYTIRAHTPPPTVDHCAASAVRTFLCA